MIVLKDSVGNSFALGLTLQQAIENAICKTSALFRIPAQTIDYYQPSKYDVTLRWELSPGNVLVKTFYIKEKL